MSEKFTSRIRSALLFKLFLITFAACQTKTESPDSFSDFRSSGNWIVFFRRVTILIGRKSDLKKKL